MSVTIKDDNNIPKLMKNLKKLNGSTISVGVPDGEMSDIAAVHEFGATITAKKKYLAIPLQKKYRNVSPRSVSGLFFVPSKSGSGGTLCLSKGKGKNAKVEACYWLTKSVKIPERSFIRGTAESYEKKYYTFVEKQLDKWLQSNSNPDPMLDALGLQFRGYMQKYVRDLSSPPNSGLTKAVKGSGNPLIDTSALLSSIEYSVE